MTALAQETPDVLHWLTALSYEYHGNKHACLAQQNQICFYTPSCANMLYMQVMHSHF